MLAQTQAAALHRLSLVLARRVLRHDVGHGRWRSLHVELVVGGVGCEGKFATRRRAGLRMHALDSARIVIGLESFLINLLFAARLTTYVLELLIGVTFV